MLGESDEILPDKDTGSEEFLAAVLSGAEIESCAVCHADVADAEFVNLCTCSNRASRIHVDCVKLLSENSNGFLRCTNRNCNIIFNQYLGPYESEFRNRLGFKRYKNSALVAILVTWTIGLIQLIVMSSISALSPHALFKIVVPHIISICLYIITAILLMQLRAVDMFTFHRNRASTIQSYNYILAVFISASLLNILPTLNNRNVFLISAEFAIWLFVFCNAIVPAVTWIVVRILLQERSFAATAPYLLKQADVHTPTYF